MLAFDGNMMFRDTRLVLSAVLLETQFAPEHGVMI
jgi:hypothetical protein